MEKLSISGDGIDITAQFNPADFTLNKSVKIEDQETTGLNGTEPQFIRGENEKLSIKLFFDGSIDGQSVRAQTDAVLQLARIVPSLQRVPVVTVTWGTALSFKAVTESVQRQFTLFDRDGNPLRAQATVGFKEYKTAAEFHAEVHGQLSPHTRRWVVRRGDSLAGIAAAAYRDPAAWRLIAESNASAIASPRRLEAGTVLILPPNRGVRSAR